MKDFHMQRHLIGEQLFVGQNVDVIDGYDHASRDGISIGLCMKHVITKMCSLALQLGRMVNKEALH